MAEVCGLHLVPTTRRDPLQVSTKGVGELILHAMKKVRPRLLLGLVEALQTMAELAWLVRLVMNS